MSFVFCAACMCPGGLQKSMRRRLLCPPRNVSLGHRTWNAGHCLSRARAIHHRHGLLLLSADVHIGKVVALQRIFGKTHQICISPMWNKPNVAIPPTWPYGLGHHRGNGIQFLNNTCTGGGGVPWALWKMPRPRARAVADIQNFALHAHRVKCIPIVRPQSCACGSCPPRSTHIYWLLHTVAGCCLETVRQGFRTSTRLWQHTTSTPFATGNVALSLSPFVQKWIAGRTVMSRNFHRHDWPFLPTKMGSYLYHVSNIVISSRSLPRAGSLLCLCKRPMNNSLQCSRSTRMAHWLLA